MFRDSQLAQLIDPVLENDDFDNDGMIDYAEFIMAQLKTKAGEREAIEVSVWKKFREIIELVLEEKSFTFWRENLL